MTTVKILTAPLITLSLNTTEVFDSILSGDYDKKPSFLKGSTSPLEMATTHLVSKSSDNQEDTYVRVTMTGDKIDVATTGVRGFRGEEGGECFYCRLEYDHEGLGICTGTGSDGEETVYYVDDKPICSPPCLISYLGYIHIPPLERGKIERDTLAMLRAICGQDYVPIPSNDFRLLKRNRGSLTREEWDEGCKYDSSQVKFVKIASVKSEFLSMR